MAESNDRWIDAIAKLIRLTQEGKVEWHSEEPPDYLKGDEDDFVITVFVTSFNGRRLRIYKNLYKRERDLSELIGSIGRGLKRIKYVLDQVVVFEILDESNNAVWALSGKPSLADLLSAVAYQVSDAKGLLDELTAPEIRTRTPGQKKFPPTETL